MSQETMHLTLIAVAVITCRRCVFGNPNENFFWHSRSYLGRFTSRESLSQDPLVFF